MHCPSSGQKFCWFKWPHDHMLCHLYWSESWDVFCINKIVSGCIVSARLPLTVLSFCMPGRFPTVVSTDLCCWLYANRIINPFVVYQQDCQWLCCVKKIVINCVSCVSGTVSDCFLSTRLSPTVYHVSVALWVTVLSIGLSLTVFHVSVALWATVLCQMDCWH